MKTDFRNINELLKQNISCIFYAHNLETDELHLFHTKELVKRLLTLETEFKGINAVYCVLEENNNQAYRMVMIRKWYDELLLQGHKVILRSSTLRYSISTRICTEKDDFSIEAYLVPANNKNKILLGRFKSKFDMDMFLTNYYYSQNQDYLIPTHYSL